MILLGNISIVITYYLFARDVSPPSWWTSFVSGTNMAAMSLSFNYVDKDYIPRIYNQPKPRNAAECPVSLITTRHLYYQNPFRNIFLNQMF
jgi:hypothetical protein